MFSIIVLDQIKTVFQSLGYSRKILIKIDKKFHTNILQKLYIFLRRFYRMNLLQFFKIILNTTEDSKNTFECIRMLVTIYSTGGHVNGAQKKSI